MKHCIIALSAVLVAASSFGQATFQLNNRIVGTVDAPIFVGSLSGAKADGAAYVVGLFGGPAGAAEGSLALAGATLPFRSGAQAGYGIVANTDTTRAIAGTQDNATAAVQLRAWPSSFGTDAAGATAAAAAGQLGKSAVLSLAGGGSQTPPSALAGLQSFFIPVPEPGVAALGLLGAGLLVIRRKK